MADETKIGMKLDKETETVSDICEKLGDVIKREFDGGIDRINTHEMGEVIDMYKDLSEAKKNIVKACYYKQIMEAMEKADEEGEYEDEESGVRFYRGQARNARGQFMSRGGGRRGYEIPEHWYLPKEVYGGYDPEYWRDMDRERGKMYYSAPNRGYEGENRSNSNVSDMRGNYSGMSTNRDSREGRSGQSRRSYVETQEMYANDTTPESKQAKMRELERYMNDLSSDVTELIVKMSPEEKNTLRAKMQALQQKIV